MPMKFYIISLFVILAYTSGCFGPSVDTQPEVEYVTIPAN